MKVANVPGIGTCKLEALKVPMIADPGDKWEYGINIDWAGKAVERVSGLSLRRLHARAHLQRRSA